MPGTSIDRVAGDVFQAAEDLEIWELKGAEGEIVLRISGAEGKESPYFGSSTSETFQPLRNISRRALELKSARIASTFPFC